MKIVIASLALFAASQCVVVAGPEPISGKEMKQVAPVPVECPRWSGFYVGAFGGYKFSNVDTEMNLDGEWNTLPSEIQSQIEGSTPDLDNSGAELGGLIGYNFQWHNWVFGGEVAGGYLWSRDSEVTDINIDAFDAYVLTSSFKTHYLLTVAPRIGYAFCRWMPYITGGLAVGDLEYSQRLVNITLREFNESFREQGSNEETNVGWMIGGGLEYALTNHWRLRGQYQYIDLGDVDFHTAGTGVGGPAELFTGHHQAELREHNASFALIYQF